MTLSPQQLKAASFRTVKKGYDPDEVSSFLSEAARTLEESQNQATAMEARARAAVARLQEINAEREAESTDDVHVPVDEAETISRTLLLAQRTADTTVADATAESERILTSARDEASTTLDSTREMSARLLEEARVEARQQYVDEKAQIEAEVLELTERRTALRSDIDALEAFLVDQRSRLRESATALVDLAERVPGGLGTIAAPASVAKVPDRSDDAGYSDGTDHSDGTEVTAVTKVTASGSPMTLPVREAGASHPDGPDVDHAALAALAARTANPDDLEWAQASELAAHADDVIDFGDHDQDHDHDVETDDTPDGIAR